MVLHGWLCGRVGAAGFKTWSPAEKSAGLFSETQISKAKRMEICKSNYPRSEAERDLRLELQKRSALKFASRTIPEAQRSGIWDTMVLPNIRFDM